MDPVLFLDIDGVLNAHEFDPEILCGQIHRAKVFLLNSVLRATGAKVVVSSAWRYLVHRGEMNLTGLEWLLRSHGLLADRLIGITRPDTMARGVYNGAPGTWPQTNERGRQVADWRAENGHAGVYAVVDDLDLGISEAGHPFVQTDGKVGLLGPDADRLFKLLNGEDN